MHWISICVSFRIFNLTKYELMNFPSSSTRGHLVSQNVDFFSGGGGYLSERVQSREDQPKASVINHYLMSLCDKTRLQRFTLTTLNKLAVTQVRSLPAGAGLQVQVLLLNLLFFFLFSNAVMWINISMKNQMISILMFWVRVFLCLLNASLIEQGRIFI